MFTPEGGRIFTVTPFPPQGEKGENGQKSKMQKKCWKHSNVSNMRHHFSHFESSKFITPWQGAPTPKDGEQGWRDYDWPLWGSMPSTGWVSEEVCAFAAGTT